MKEVNLEFKKFINLAAILWIAINLIYKVYGAIVIDNIEWIAFVAGVICIALVLYKSILDIYALVSIFFLDLLGFLPTFSINFLYVIYWNSGFEIVIRVATLIPLILIVIANSKELGIISEENK